MPTATLPDIGKRFTHRETPLSGNSIVTSSRYSFPINGGIGSAQGILELRLALTHPYSHHGIDDDLDLPSDKSGLPLTVSLVERPDNSNIAYVDAYFFQDSNLKDHGYKTIQKDPQKGWVTYSPQDFATGVDENSRKGLLSDLTLDDDDTKLDNWGGLLSEMLKSKRAPPVIERHPVYQGLRNNKYYQVRSQSMPPQLSLSCLQLLRHEEIPLHGALFEAAYFPWIFPPDPHPDSRERYLEFRISQANLEDLDMDPLLRDQLPLVFEMVERVGNYTNWDSYLFVDGIRASHSFTSETREGKKSGHDRTFTKLQHYREPISSVVSVRLPPVLQTHNVIKKLREKTLFEKDEPMSSEVSAA